MKTYQDLIEVGESEQARMEFCQSLISEHKASALYKRAVDADMYARGKNATIQKYQKVLYKLTGQAVPDKYTANHKCKSGFFKLFITQEASFQVGNGVTFEKEETKKKLGKDFDTVFYKAVKAALVQAVAFIFFNLDHCELYKVTEFAPLYSEDTGALMAGVRWWQIDTGKPMRYTLFEPDGYTEYVRDDNGVDRVLKEKRKYKLNVSYTEADGEEIVEGENYKTFPVIPLYGNIEKQSELEGKREQIDCYDLIKSGFANDLDDASMIYWTLTNCGGMDDIDVAKFIQRMKVVKAAVVGAEGDENPKAEAHTVEVPYQSRETYLERLRKDLYTDFMALDVSQIAAGATTATQIKAAYEPLVEKCDELEMCLFEFINALLAVDGIDDTPSFKRSMISNEGEFTQMVLSAAEYLDEQTVLELLPWLPPDKVKEILDRKAVEEASRYKEMELEVEEMKRQKEEEGLEE